MKYLEAPSFVPINAILSRLETRDCFLNGKLEAYTCKMASSDKKLFATISSSLDHQIHSSAGGIAISESLGTSAEFEAALGIRSSSFSNASPFGPLTDGQSRRTFISLIQVLNASYPDYDFSSLKPEDFTREEAPAFRSNVDLLLLTTAAEQGALLQPKIWAALEAEVKFSECEIYSYRPDPDRDPFANHRCLWSFHSFFYHRKLKRVVLFTCRAASKAGGFPVEDGSPYMSDDDGSFNGGMYEDQVADEMEY